jgi:hypothetical protein
MLPLTNMRSFFLPPHRRPACVGTRRSVSRNASVLRESFAEQNLAQARRRELFRLPRKKNRRPGLRIHGAIAGENPQGHFGSECSRKLSTCSFEAAAPAN